MSAVLLSVCLYVGDSLEMRGNFRGIIIIMQLFGIIETIHVKPGHRRLLLHAVVAHNGQGEVVQCV